MFYIKEFLCLGLAARGVCVSQHLRCPWRRRAATASVLSETWGGLCLFPWTGLSSWYFFILWKIESCLYWLYLPHLKGGWVFFFFLILCQVKTSHLLAHVAWITRTLSVEVTGLTQSHRRWGAAIISSILHSSKSTSQTTRCAPSLISSLSR